MSFLVKIHANYGYKSNFRYNAGMRRIIALSPKKKTAKPPYKSPKRLAAKKEMLAKKAAKKAGPGGKK